MIISCILFLIVGLLAGLASGLLGIGGGAITVPSLAFLFFYLRFPQSHLMHLAIGTSLASMVLNSACATYFHHRAKTISWKRIKSMLPGIFLGAVLGTLIAKELSTSLLQGVFGFFSGLIGLYLLFPKLEKSSSHRLKNVTLNIFTTGIACFSNILGLGGGTFFVPLFNYYRIPEKETIGTSIAAAFLITCLGTAEYMLFGPKTGTSLLPQGCIGYIYLPAFILIGISGFFGSFYGTRWVSVLPTKTLKRYFAYAMLLVGLSMILF